MTRIPGITSACTFTCALTLLAASAAGAADAKNFKLLYSFQGGNDGTQPAVGLMVDQDGNLYGTTYTGGAQNAGTLFELPAGGQRESALHLHGRK
jgi:uncharacterized repeat protein (TIGR03803 family)